MKTLTRQKITTELLWWLFTAVLAIFVLLPIWLNAPLFPFFYQNTILIATFITFTRYIFLLPLTLIARLNWVKLFIVAVSAIMFFVMTTALSDFHNFIDEEGLQTLVSGLHVNVQTRMINYMKSEMIFFGVGSVISGVILPFRMIISIWRVRNRNTV